MKTSSLILGTVFFSLTTFAASTELENCASKALEVATIFQNEIIGEMFVNSAEITETKKTTEGLEYLINTANLSGSRLRDTLVKTDEVCNVQSISRADSQTLTPTPVAVTTAAGGKCADIANHKAIADFKSEMQKYQKQELNVSLAGDIRTSSSLTWTEKSYSTYKISVEESANQGADDFTLTRVYFVKVRATDLQAKNCEVVSVLQTK